MVYVDEDELKTQIFEEVSLALLFNDALGERDGMIDHGENDEDDNSLNSWDYWEQHLYFLTKKQLEKQVDKLDKFEEKNNWFSYKIQTENEIDDDILEKAKEQNKKNKNKRYYLVEVAGTTGWIKK